jgi:hypothetical protein
MLCTIKNTNDECVKQIIQSGSNKRPLDMGIQVYGDTKTYSLKPPSADWTKLDSGRNESFPHRDMRIIHNTGAGFIDVNILKGNQQNAYDLARNEIDKTVSSFSGELEILSTEKWLEIAKDSSFLRYCFNIENKGEGCFYSLAIKDIDQAIVIVGSMANVGSLIEEIELFLLSTERVKS